MLRLPILLVISIIHNINISCHSAKTFGGRSEGLIFTLTASDCCQLGVRRFQWGSIRQWTLSTHYVSSSITGWWKGCWRSKTIYLYNHNLCPIRTTTSSDWRAKKDLFKFITSSQSATAAYISNNVARGGLLCLWLSDSSGHPWWRRTCFLLFMIPSELQRVQTKVQT